MTQPELERLALSAAAEAAQHGAAGPASFASTIPADPEALGFELEALAVRVAILETRVFGSNE